MRDSWTSTWTGKTYTNVAEIARTTEYQVTDPSRRDNGKVYTGRSAQHWVEVDGLWRLIYPEAL